MALSPICLSVEKDGSIGQFKELEFGHTFDFCENGLTEWDKAQGATHKVFVGGIPHLDRGFRGAIVKKTVAYVITDEGENGAVWEKWNIRTLWKREKSA